MTFDDFINKYKDDVIRIRVYRKVYTPYEIDKKFTDELDTTDYQFCKIKEVAELGSGEYLIMFEMGWMDEDNEFVYSNRDECYKLSDIIIERFRCDNEPYCYEEEEP